MLVVVVVVVGGLQVFYGGWGSGVGRGAGWYLDQADLFLKDLSVARVHHLQ